MSTGESGGSELSAGGASFCIVPESWSVTR